MAENYYIDELCNAKLSFTLRDEDNATITLSAVGTFTLTLYNKSDSRSQYYLATINNRNTQDVLNANNVAISSTGTIVWSMQYDDNEILDSDEQEELHIALFNFYYGGKRGNVEFNFYVKNLHYVS